MTEELDQLKADLLQKQADLDAKRVHLAQAQAKVIDLQSEVASAQAAVNAAQAKVDNYTESDMDELERLRAELAEAEAELIGRKSVYADAVAGLEKLLDEQADAYDKANAAKIEWDRLAKLYQDVVSFVGEQEVAVEKYQTGINEAQAKVEAIQAEIDALEPDEPDPLPADIYQLTLPSGKQCTFRTPPPVDLAVRPHPRFLIPGREEELQRKLSDVDHTEQRRLAKWQRPHSYEALLYAIDNRSITNGQAAKDWLLSLPAEIQTTNNAAGLYHEYLVYDWCHDLFTAEEREQLFQTFCTRIGIIAPQPGSTEFGIVPERLNREKGDGFDPAQWFGNDVSDPSQNMGFLWRGLLALAFYGDGVRDEWCRYVYQRMLDSGDNRIYPVYDPVHGGLLDAHNQRALDSGGIQSSWDTELVMPGYESYFSAYIVDFMAAWCTATGDDLFSDNNYTRLMPHRLAYRWHKGLQLGQARMQQTVAQLTGLYRESDPQMAGLARWLIDHDSQGTYQLFEVFVLGDMSVAPIRPADAGLPLAKTLLGDDICTSRSSLDPDATVVELFTRTMDSHRYEPEVGGLHIVRDGKPLIMRGRGRKGSIESLLTCNTMIIPKGQRLQINNQGNTYWGAAHMRGPHALTEWVDRATSVIDVVTHPSYRGILPTEELNTDAYSVFGVDSAKFRQGLSQPDNSVSYQRLDVAKAKRTVVHLRPNSDGREFVVVYDRLEVGDGLEHLWLARFLNEPMQADNGWYAENDGQAISGTVLSPDMELLVRGGSTGTPEQLKAFDDEIKSLEDRIKNDENADEAKLLARLEQVQADRYVLFRETEGPDGESYDGVAKVFYDAPSKYTPMHGEYAVFIRPKTALPKQDYCVVFEVGDTGFVPADAMMAGKVVSVGGWTVDFSIEDQTKVRR